jgi:adenylate kinase family enzyme
MLFIKGKPGSGKSTLARFVKEQFVTHHNPKSVIIGDIIYSARDGEFYRSDDIMLSSLRYRIFAANEWYCIHFLEVYRQLS